MKLFIQSPDDQNRVDGTIQANLLNHLPDLVGQHSDADVVIVPISQYSDYRFNPKLNDIPKSKPVVIIDFLEYEWNYWDVWQHTHFIGLNTRECKWLGTDHWWKFDDWAAEHRPILYFKRELQRGIEEIGGGVSKVLPIEFPCYLGDQPNQSEEEFLNRPIEVFFSWGFSHPSRPLLQAKIFEGIVTHGLGVISEKDQFEGYFRNPSARTWTAIFSPWFSRHPITDTVWYQSRSKMSVSLPGAGTKCFRSSESPVSSIMALQEDDLAWSYPWIHGENCIRLRPGHEFEDLDAATKRADLYQIYLNSGATIAKYRCGPYARDYVYANIEKALNANPN